MITCSQCGAQNLPGLAYCENCGSPLPQQTAPTAATPTPAAPPSAPSADAGLPAQAPPQPDPVAAAMPQPVMPVDQPPPAPETSAAAPAASGANLVAADAAASGANAVSADAGAIAVPPASTDGNAVATPATPAAVSAAPATAGGTTLTITFPSGQVFTMQGDIVDVGRADVAQNWHPELDVIPFGGGAPDLGVSRHQARLLRQDGGFAVIDVGSTNGTYINGHAAPYNQAVPLGDGDTLSFGALNTQISIR